VVSWSFGKKKLFKGNIKENNSDFADPDSNEGSILRGGAIRYGYFDDHGIRINASGFLSIFEYGSYFKNGKFKLGNYCTLIVFLA